MVKNFNNITVNTLQVDSDGRWQTILEMENNHKQTLLVNLYAPKTDDLGLFDVLLQNIQKYDIIYEVIMVGDFNSLTIKWIGKDHTMKTIIQKIMVP